MSKVATYLPKALSILLLLGLGSGTAFAGSDVAAPAAPSEWQHAGTGSGRTATPTDFDKLLLFLSSTPFTPVDGGFMVDGLFGGTGMHFQTAVLQRTDAEIAQNRAEAIAFFQSRFGLDVSDSRVHFTGFEILPDLEYRAVVVSNERVPVEGWTVHDGGWIAVVMDPQGLDLGGEFAGTHVPAGTMVVFGNYKVDRLPTSFILSYRARKPIVPQSDGAFQVSCEVHSDEFGDGQAIGSVLPIILPNGQMMVNTRNVITFPPFGKTAQDLM